MLSKNEIRKVALNDRNAICANNHQSFSRAIYKSILGILQHEPLNSVIGGYIPIRGEVDALYMLKKLMHLNYTVALPAISLKDESMLFRRYTHETQMEQGFKNILQPNEKEDVLSPDILLVPLLAFRADGHRIGYGAGYYDRILSRYKAKGRNLLTIGLAFECQKFDDFEITPYDQPLQYVVTERSVYACN